MNFSIDGINVEWNESEYKKSLVEELLVSDYEKLQEFFAQYKAIDKSVNKKINVLVREPMFGFHYCGMRRNMNITLFGLEHNYFIHELTHVYLPNQNFLLHEGTADFLQQTISQNKMNWAGHSLFEIPFIHYQNKYSEKPQSLATFLNEEGNYNDTRMNRCFFARGCATIISKKIFFDDAHNLSVEQEIKNLEDMLRNSTQADTTLDSYYKQKKENLAKWIALEKYGIDQTGNPLQNWDSIAPEVRDEAFALYLKDLKMDTNPLLQEF